MREFNRDLAMWWRILNDLSKELDRIETERQKKLKSLQMIKGNIRKLNKDLERYKPKPEDNWRARYPDDGYGDTSYVKYKLPYHMTDKEKEEYREAEWCHWYNPYNDGRDCTCVWFTSRIRIIDCGENETIVIHVKNCDV